MKYKANPVEVNAYKIIHLGSKTAIGLNLTLYCPETGEEINRVATNDMMSRYTPIVGDYWVIQEDGYEYLNPKDVFERKYHKIGVEKE